LEILTDDLEAYFGKEDEADMVVGFKSNTKRYISMFTSIAG